MSVRFESFGAMLRTPPTLSLSGGPRNISHDFGWSDHMTLAGGGFMWNMTFEKNWILSLLDFRFAGATGARPELRVPIDGSVASIRTWSTSMVEFSLFPLVPAGIGYKTRSGRVELEGLLLFGATYSWAYGSVSAPRGATDITIDNWSPLVRLDLVGCANASGPLWLCALAAPNVYEFGWLNGGQAGLVVKLEGGL